ncbi:GNAT family N-acetyltransferase [Bacillus sp. FJAT-49705]|uniref:GNAT family N-acetyltransferase n=1 Tax=Cytobacillus citreus TaxID=2833586 RepID=A0ABS5NX80_9BACI|nr:GNAT family N-acetyltransferase [Cytobacillus citreus]MBS4192448.1 GNAT family N-acetyltransferase [Cytobacillus citreus]
MQLIEWNEERLEELVDFWNKELREQYPMRKELFKQNSFKDLNICFSGSAIAINDDNEIIGFIVAKKWNEDNLNIQMNKENGWIQALLVDSNWRNKGIGTVLLEKAESALAKEGVKKVFIGRDPWHYFPGVPAEFKNINPWFEKKGYINDGYDHDLIAYYEQKIDAQIPDLDEVEFSMLKEEEKDELLSFLNRCFPGRWEYEAIHYFKKGGTGREFVVLKKNNRIIGFCRVNDSKSPFIAQNVYWSPLLNGELGGIGPLGVDSEERKKGYGIAIVEAGIAALRSHGVNQIVIDWTGLVEFYGKLGYKKWKSYTKFSKNLVDYS